MTYDELKLDVREQRWPLNILPMTYQVLPRSNWQFVKGTIGWLLQVMLLKVGVTVFTWGLRGTVAWHNRVCRVYIHGDVSCWAGENHLETHMCTGIFLAKTLKLTLYTEFGSYSSKQHYVLLDISFAQFPLICWLSNTTGNYFFWYFVTKSCVCIPFRCTYIGFVAKQFFSWFLKRVNCTSMIFLLRILVYYFPFLHILFWVNRHLKTQS